MDYFKKIFKESIIIVIISSILGLTSGTLLSINKEILYTIPIILLILPALSSLIGDMSTVLISRLTTHLYIGTIPPKIQKSDRLKKDFLGLLITIVLSLAVLLVLGNAIGVATGIEIVNPFLITFVIILTVLILFGILFVLLFISSIYIFKRGKDPNNFLIPFVTSLADFLTPFLLILFIIIFI
jgi:cation transporter-like permease